MIKDIPQDTFVKLEELFGRDLVLAAVTSAIKLQVDVVAQNERITANLRSGSTGSEAREAEQKRLQDERN